MFHEMHRTTWFVTYILVWLLTMAALILDAPYWVSALLGAALLAGSLATTPAPRNVAPRVSRTCGCARCDRMRARHTRRRTDATDVG